MATETQEALIIADQTDLGRDLRNQLEALGWQTIVTNSVGPGRKLIEKNHLDLLVVDETVLPVVDESTFLTEKPRFENSANRSLWNCTAPGHGTGGSQSRSSCPRSWEV